MSRKNKNIMITGGTGFLGNNLSRYMLDKYPDRTIVNYSRHTYAVNPLTHKDLWKLPMYKSVAGDLNDVLLFKETLEKYKIGLIYHLAASTHVDRSFIYPEEFLTANVAGTFNILEVIRRVKKKPLMIYMGTDEVFGDVPKGFCREDGELAPRNPYSASKACAEMYCIAYTASFGLPIIRVRCHDEKTRALTENGLKLSHELEIGEKVWVRGKNGKLKLEPILEIPTYVYIGKMIHFKTGTIDSLVTPEHRVVCKSRRKMDKEYYIKIAKEFKSIGKSSRYYLPKTAKWEGIEKDFIDLDSLVSLDNLHPSTIVPKRKIKTITLFSLFGWHISEGSCQQRKGEIGNKNPEYREEIANLINDFGLSCNNNSKRETVGYSSVILSRILSEAGKGAENKKIPKWILNFSPKYLIHLYNALMKGDGNRNQEYNTDVYYTVSEKLVNSMIELILKLGWSPRISVRETWNPQKTKKRKSFVIRISRHHNKGSIEGKNINSESYSGIVWCLKTPSGNFFVERNGCIINSGNSMNMFGPYQHPEKLIGKIVTRCLTDTHFTLYKGGSVRGWIFVKDTCDALDVAARKGNVGEVYHIPPDAYLTVPEVAEKILKITGKQELFDGYKGRRLKDDERYALDATKFTYELKWRPPTRFDEGIQKTVKWFGQNEWFWARLH